MSAHNKSMRAPHAANVDPNFAECYARLCRKYDLPQIKGVIAFTGDQILDVNGDKLTAQDWKPLAESLEVKNDLKFIAVRSYWRKDKSNESRTAPAIQSAPVTERLASAVAITLSHTAHLRCLELQRLPLNSKSIQTLSQSFAFNHTLQHLSLQQSSIDDGGTQVLCKALKTCFNITSINLIGCELTWKAMHSLANLVKHQALLRNTQAWQDSLRDKVSKAEQSIGGLQRISINNNPLIGDRGAYVIAELLKEDVWLKALDIQNCGIQDAGARAFLSSMKCNSTLYILDVRRNFIRDVDVLMRISQQLSFNIQDQSSQYKWLPIVSSKTENGVVKGTGKVWRKRGIPWRVSSRLSLSRCLPLKQTPGIANIFLQSNRPSLSGSEAGLATKASTSTARVKKRSSMNEGRCKTLVTIETEFKQLQELLLAERALRLQAEKKTKELESENANLKTLLSMNESNSKLDEKTLVSIEETFTNFNEFIQMLQCVS